MDVTPAPTADRLARADRLTTEAAQVGAGLVVLPELFNIGYAYTDDNYRLAELPGGPTATWMKETAARLNVHLAGSLLLLDRGEVYNSLLLVAPDGRVWRYDKNYPWGWERAYFRPAHRVTVAHTDLGAVGMMICWDASHRRLWRRYAGRVVLMIIASCPPDVSNPTFHFPNGDRLTFDDMGPAFARLKGSARRVFGDMIDQQAAWLGVPTVNTVGSGRVETPIPNGPGTILAFAALAPWLVRYLSQADRVRMTCGMTPGCKVVDGSGQVVAEVSQERGEAFAIAEVGLADQRPRPCGPQPPSPVPRLAYLSSDLLLPALTAPLYRRGVRRVWGR